MFSVTTPCFIRGCNAYIVIYCQCGDYGAVRMIDYEQDEWSCF